MEIQGYSIMQEVGSNIIYLHYDMICSNGMCDMRDKCDFSTKKLAMLVCFADFSCTLNISAQN
jgi:hypothetical protein